MLKGLIPYQNIEQLILSDKFGWYLLTNLSGTQTYAGSHIANDETAEIAPTQIVDQLLSKLKMIGEGSYKIQLKKTPKTVAAAMVTYQFNYGDAGANATAQNTQLNGIPLNEVDQRIEKAVSDALAKQAEKHEMDKQIADLKRLIEEVKKEKKAEPSNYKELAGVGKMILGMAAAKFTPEAMPMINKMLAADNDDDDNDAPEEKRTVTRS